MTVIDRTITTPVESKGNVLLDSALDVLDQRGVAFCLPQGDDPAGADTDVVADISPRELVKLLQDKQIGAEVVQYFRDDAQYFVLAAPGEQGKASLLALHFSRECQLAGYVLYSGSELLSHRRRQNGVWVPAAPHQFASLFARRVMKGRFTSEDLAQLHLLCELDREGALARLARWYDKPEADRIFSAICEHHTQLPSAEQLLSWKGKLVRHLRRIRWETCSEIAGLFRRLLSPPGLHAVFLGPDGVGKTTVIDRVQSDLRPAFTGMRYRTFAPMLLRRNVVPENGPKPHSLKQRSRLAAFAKAVYWLIYYSIGYLFTGFRDKVAGRLAINHRYLMDAIVDPRRYRYSGPVWLLKLIWSVVPKPDLVIVLDAPADVIQARKSEVTPEETARQSAAYRELARRSANAVVIDASQPLEQVVADTEWAILHALTKRTRGRLEVDGK